MKPCCTLATAAAIRAVGDVLERIERAMDRSELSWMARAIDLAVLRMDLVAAIRRETRETCLAGAMHADDLEQPKEET